MPTPLRRGVRRALDAPHLPIAVYLAVVGVNALGGKPEAEMAYALPPWLAYVWALALVAGAVLIAWGVLADATRAESSGHGLHLFGLSVFTAVHLVYGPDVSLVAVGVHLVYGPDVSLVAVGVLALVSVLRMRILVRARAARRQAGEIVRGGAT